ncbi:unnamed protein product [Mycena citricolor]|uniref:Uncharacterized protein n=1 Tax=Mycena citricolor TaxID=2018698 RepID=A0AAD2HYY8_9AGAR|nr:unnamed protein product [Mycena citricolor]
MHEDLDLGPPLAFTDKAISKAPKKPSAWVYPPSANSDSDSGSDTTASISFMIPLGGPSHVRDSDFPLLTGWTQAFIDQFQTDVESLAQRKFHPKLSLKDQDPKIKAQVVAEDSQEVPHCRQFIDHWPLEKVLIRICKNSAAKWRR